jgi:pimeloyl-ACP methyl ester carboxylesterase
MKRPIPLAALFAITAVLTACSEGSPDSRKATLTLKSCRVPHIENEVKCATLDVIENRETGAGRKIPLNIVVLPATSRTREPDPIFVFAGGPGQAAADLGREAMALLGGLNARRDIVLIDQRGTGKSNGLFCKSPDLSAMSGDAAKRDQIAREALEACRDELATRADLTQYTTTIAVADINEARLALGYDKINMWGGSYGTRSSMEYLRRYPDTVRSVVIDGVAPPSLALPVNFGRDAGAAYAKAIAACEKEPGCGARFPGMKSQLDSVLESVRKGRKSRVADPMTGEVKEIDITPEMVLTSVFTALYVPEMAALLPANLAEASKGNFAPLLAQGALFGDFAEDKMAMGMRLSVVCAEDLPRLSDAAAAAEAARSPFGRFFIDEFRKGCAIWPKGKMAAGFDQPVVSDKPVLILSGGLDPVTPPPMGDEVKKSLSQALHLVAPNLGHGVGVHGCAPRLTKQFIESASISGLDGACLTRLPRPMFYQPIKEKTGEQK